MGIYNDLINNNDKIVVVGLGYVGLPLAVAFAKKGIKVIGFDINEKKINKYLNGEDATSEVGNDILRTVKIDYTYDPNRIKEGKFIIIAVPTPVNEDNIPDLTAVKETSKIVGQYMDKGSIVVYESTVYPGVTEDICVDILEEKSGMKSGIDFKVGYSPERINPGDKVHTLSTVMKIVSGMDEESLEEIAKVYEIIISAGVHRASSIKVAEAAKVIENIQRDVNIALVNELSEIFEKLNIDTHEVIEAAGTKWNYIKYNPGLVGGHCIGVDPYYLIHRAEQLGYNPKILKTAREINDHMSERIVNVTINKMKEKNIDVRTAKILVMGISFKENVTDIRNSKVVNIINGLIKVNDNVEVIDYVVDKEEVLEEYNIKLKELDSKHKYDVVVMAVSHDKYRKMSSIEIVKLFNNESGVLIDVKSIVNFKELPKSIDYWRM